jgi:hypothetical protein
MAVFLLRPLGAATVPDSVGEAVREYRRLREHAERRFRVTVPRTVERAVSSVLDGE